MVKAGLGVVFEALEHHVEFCACDHVALDGSTVPSSHLLSYLPLIVVVKVRIPVELESLTQGSTEELGLGLITLEYLSVMLECWNGPGRVAVPDGIYLAPEADRGSWISFLVLCHLVPLLVVFFAQIASDLGRQVVEPLFESSELNLKSV